MRLPMRHLLASSAVAGLLFLLPAGGANAQDNRNSWGWGVAGGGGMVLSFIAAAAGAAGGSSIVLWKLSKLASKRDDDFKKLNNNIKVLDEKLTALDGKLTKTEEDGREKLLLNKQERLALAEQELVKIERKVCDMETRTKTFISADKIKIIGDEVRHLLHVDVKKVVEKIMSITGISDSKIQSYPGISNNIDIAKRWLENTRKALDEYKRNQSSDKHDKYMPDQDFGLDPQNPYEISKS